MVVAEPDLDERAPTVRNRLGSVTGPVHAGVGHQFNYVYEAARRRRGPLTVDNTYGERLDAAFVTTTSYQQASAILHRSRVVLLSGERGVGRRTAAVQLLTTVGGAEIRLLDTVAEVPGEPEFTAEDVTAGTRLLLDLTDVDEAPARRLLAQFSGIVNDVRRHGAVAVVVLGAAASDVVPDELRDFTRSLTRPSGAQVLVSHLAAREIPAGSLQAWPSEVRGFVEHAAMAAIRDLAVFTRQAADARPHADLTSWLAEAWTALGGWSKEVAKVFDTLDARRRTLLIATAMFDGFALETVVEAEQRLPAAVGFVPDDGHDLVRPDLGARLGDIGATTDGERVGWSAPNYAAAVRRHVWTHFPGLRRGVHAWALDAGELVAPSQDDSVEFVARLATTAFRGRRPDLVLDAVVQWSARPSCRPLAAAALEYGLTDVDQARLFRARCLEWARSNELSPALAELLVSASADVIARGRPVAAMVRLHRLTPHHDSARDRLAELLHDPYLLRRFLTRLTQHSFLDHRHHQRVFLDVVDAAVVQGTPAVLEKLHTCWQAVFTGTPTNGFEPAVGRWLDAAVTDPRRERLLQVLVEAAPTPRVLAALHGVTHRWLAAAGPNGLEARSPVAARFLRSITAAHRDHRDLEERPR